MTAVITVHTAAAVGRTAASGGFRCTWTVSDCTHDTGKVCCILTVYQCKFCDREAVYGNILAGEYSIRTQIESGDNDTGICNAECGTGSYCEITAAAAAAAASAASAVAAAASASAAGSTHLTEGELLGEGFCSCCKAVKNRAGFLCLVEIDLVQVYHITGIPTRRITLTIHNC